MTNPEGPSGEPGLGFFLLKGCFSLANVACYVVRFRVFVKRLETFLIVTDANNNVKNNCVIRKEVTISGVIAFETSNLVSQFPLA